MLFLYIFTKESVKIFARSLRSLALYNYHLIIGQQDAQNVLVWGGLQPNILYIFTSVKFFARSLAIKKKLEIRAKIVLHLLKR